MNPPNMATVRLNRRVLRFNWRCFLYNRRFELPEDLRDLLDLLDVGLSIMDEYASICEESDNILGA